MRARMNLWPLVVLAAAGIVAGVAFLVPARADAKPTHHTTCYFDNQNPSPHGSYDKYAYGTHFFWFYIASEGVGTRGVRVWFSPDVHGHAHSCLHLEGAVSVSEGSIGRGHSVLARVFYRRASDGAWERAGRDMWWSSTPSLRSPAWHLTYTSPRQFTHAKVVVWYYGGGAYSFPRRIVCALGRHGQSSYECSAGSGS